MTQPAPSSPQRARRRTASSALKMAWTPPCPRPTPLPRRISSAWDHFSMTSATLRWLGVLSTPLRRRFCSIRGCSRDCWRVSQRQGWALQRAARCQTLNTRPRGRRPRLIWWRLWERIKRRDYFVHVTFWPGHPSAQNIVPAMCICFLYGSHPFAVPQVQIFKTNLAVA